jgi:protocadherin delta 1
MLRRVYPVLCVVLFVIVSTVRQTCAQTSPSSRPLEYSVFEQLPVGSFIADLLRDVNFTERYPNANTQRLRFQIRATSTNIERNVFSIDERSGVIRTNEILDREQLCSDANSQCQMTFDVSVRATSQFFQIIKVNIQIVDVNDNSPTFPEERVSNQLL